jgi:cobalamin biosynthesis protein CobT
MSAAIRTRGVGSARSRNFTSKMELLISILSEKGVKIVPGHSPSTDCKDTVYMPWLSDDATEEEFLKFFVSAVHEQAHFHGKSHFRGIPKGKKLLHFCINAVEDIRCELSQEEEYPGIKGYRKREYALDCVKGKLKEELESASKSNIKGLIIAMLKYFIVLNRVRQLEMEDTEVPASEDVKAYYDRYLSDLEDVVDEMNDCDHAIRVGKIIYKRIEDLLEDEETPDEPGDGDSCEDGDPSDEPGGESESDSEGKGKSKSKSKSSEDDSENDSEDDSDSSSEPGEGEDDSKDGSSSEDGSEGSEEESKGGSGDEDSELSEAEKEEIKAKIKTIMDDLDASDGLKTVADSYIDDVKGIAAKHPGEYYSENGVKDRIIYPRPNLPMGLDTLKKGKSLLGSIGARMTKLFVSQSRKRYLNNQDQGTFDPVAFITDVSQRRRDIYSTTIPGRLDKAAVSFAVDNSASMSGSRIKKAYQILSALLHYLDKAGVPTEAIGFTAESNTSDRFRDAAVRHTIIKTFDEAFKQKAISRCYPPSDMEQNIELEALRYLAPRLYQRPEGKKILFVLSDGAPCFGSSVMNRRMAIAYKKYIERLRELGMFVIGFGIDCSVKAYFGEHSINTSTENLGEEIVKKLTSILNARR